MGPEGGRAGGGQGRRSGWGGLAPEATEGRRPAEWDTGGGGGPRGGPAEMGSPVPLPQPGPGLPLTQPHGDRGLGPDSQCARRLRRRRQGRGTGGGGAAAAAAAPAGGSGAEGPSRGRRGLRLQRTETAGGRGGGVNESTAQARCGRRCQPERGGARAPAVSTATGRREADNPYLYLVLATAAGGAGDENNPSRSPWQRGEETAW